MAAWRKICCAVDFSDESRFALDEAAELTSRSGGALTLIHVVDDARRHGESAADRLEEWRRSAESIAKSRVSASTLAGAPADEILRFARDGGYDLLVIGTPGMLGCERIVFGSVAERVVRRAPCSVIVVRHRAAHSPVA